MAHKNLGRKRRCASCGIKFYDLTKTPAVCPACGTEFDPEVLLKSRRGRAAVKIDEPETPTKEEEVNDDDVARVVACCLRHRLRKDPLEQVDSGDRVVKVFCQVFGLNPDDREAFQLALAA